MEIEVIKPRDSFTFVGMKTVLPLAYPNQLINWNEPFTFLFDTYVCLSDVLCFAFFCSMDRVEQMMCFTRSTYVQTI